MLMYTVYWASYAYTHFQDLHTDYSYLPGCNPNFVAYGYFCSLLASREIKISLDAMFTIMLVSI